MTKPNVDWFQLQEDGLTHPSTAQQDNMRAVRMQLGGEAIDCDRAVVEAETSPVMGVGESIFSPEEIAHFRNAALAAYEESLKAIQAFHAMADHRYLEGDTEFSDSDIEDYYLGKAT